MIKVENLKFSYDKVPVLDGIDFQIGKGQLVAILGPNGAGKSTLFKCILGLLKKYTGSIELEGHNLKNLNRKELAKIAAYIPQSETPVFNYTVRDSVLMGTTGSLSPLQSPGKENIETAQRAMEYIGIEKMAHRGVNELSGGERQMVLLARALAQKANVLIMDEPTANLDYGNQQCVLKRIRKMTEEGYTVLLSTHNPEHALQYATDVLAIKDHKVLAAGKVEDTLTEELIREIYGLKVKIVDVDAGDRVVRSCVPVSPGIRGDQEELCEISF